MCCLPGGKLATLSGENDAEGVTQPPALRGSREREGEGQAGRRRGEGHEEQLVRPHQAEGLFGLKCRVQNG